jgi:ankyrin repeat protein
MFQSKVNFTLVVKLLLRGVTSQKRSELIAHSDAIKRFIQQEKINLNVPEANKFSCLIMHALFISIRDNQPNQLAQLLWYLRSYEVDYDGERMGVNSLFRFCRVNVQLIHIAVYFDRKDCLVELTKPTVYPRPTLMARTGQNDGVFSGDTILTLAAKRGSIQCLRYILETLKQDPNLTDEDSVIENGQRLPGKTPLNVVCGMYCWKGDPKWYHAAALLLAHGADPNQSSLGDYPLLGAVSHMKKDLFDLLVKYQAKYDVLMPLTKSGMYEGALADKLQALRLGITEDALEVLYAEQKHDSSSREVKLAKARHFTRQLAKSRAAERRFFSLTRFTPQAKSATWPLYQSLKHNREHPPASYSAGRKVDITGVPARRFIAADIADFRGNLSPRDLHWYALATPKGLQYNWQTLYFQRQRIRYTHNPFRGHLGNFFMGGVAAYGEIIKQINRMTGEHPIQEKLLASWMLRYAKTGRLPGLEEMRAKGFDITLRQYEDLTRICFLVDFKEIARRLLPSQHADYPEQTEFPFALTHKRALQLIQNGNLRMAEVFSADAPYGLPTGTGIANPEDGGKKAMEKIERVNRLYEEIFLVRKRHSEAKQLILSDPFARIRSTMERAHQELRSGYGGDEDTSGNEYLSELATDAEEKTTNIMQISHNEASFYQAVFGQHTFELNISFLFSLFPKQPIDINGRVRNITVPLTASRADGTIFKQNFPPVLVLFYFLKHHPEAVNVCDEYGETFLQRAIRCCDEHTVSMLIKDFEVTPTSNNNGETLLHTIALTYLATQKIESIPEVMAYSTQLNHIADLVLSYYREKRLPVNEVNRQGKTPLDVALAKNNSYAKRFAQLLERAEANFRNNPPPRSRFTSAPMATESQPGQGFFSTQNTAKVHSVATSTKPGEPPLKKRKVTRL